MSRRELSWHFLHLGRCRGDRCNRRGQEGVPNRPDSCRCFGLGGIWSASTRPDATWANVGETRAKRGPTACPPDGACEPYHHGGKIPPEGSCHPGVSTQGPSLVALDRVSRRTRACRPSTKATAR